MRENRHGKETRIGKTKMGRWRKKKNPRKREQRVYGGQTDGGTDYKRAQGGGGGGGGG